MFNRHNDNVADKTERLVRDASNSAHELGREAHHQAEAAKSDMVKTLYDTAKNLRKQAHDAGASHEVRDRVDDVADGFEKAAGYLKHNDYQDIGEDAVQTVRSYPLQTLAIVLVIGVIIGLILRDNRPHNDKLINRAYEASAAYQKNAKR